MSLNIYLTILNFFGVLGWLGVLFLVFFLSPYGNLQQNLILFLISFFLAIWGSYSTLEFSIRKRLHDLSSPKSHLMQSARHGFLLAIILTIMLFLQYLKVLTWWDGGLLVLIGISVELYLRSR